MGNKQTKNLSTSLIAAGSQKTGAKMVQNVLFIWLDKDISATNADSRNTLIQFHRIVNVIGTFTDVDRCVQFIETVGNEKLCMIISGSFAQGVIPRIHQLYQVDTIFILCRKNEKLEGWAEDWPKIHGVFTNIIPMCSAIKSTAKACEQNSLSFSYIESMDQYTKNDFEFLDPLFVYTQIFKEILLTIDFQRPYNEKFMEYCRKAFADNSEKLRAVKEFAKYQPSKAIWWYTCEGFVYPMLNRAVWFKDIDIIIKMGFFVNDLHRHIEQQYKQQFRGYSNNKTFTVYRGQKVTEATYEKITRMQGGLMAFTNFSTAHKKRPVSLDFVLRSIARDPTSIGILFVIYIEPLKTTIPFASIEGVTGIPREDRVLFSMNAVFRVGDITPMSENKRLFQVNLTLTNDDDKDLRTVCEWIRRDNFPEQDGWVRLASVLEKIGYHEESLEITQRLEAEAKKNKKDASIYYNFALTKSDRAKRKKALLLGENNLVMTKPSPSANHPDTEHSYDSLGFAHYSTGDYSKALFNYEKHLETQKKSLPATHPDMADPHIWIGNVYYSMGNYSQAALHYGKALEIQKKSLPSAHSDMSVSYQKLGLVHETLGDYPKALLHYEKHIEIQCVSVSSNDPELAVSYKNIGLVYENVGEYSKALTSYEKALQIEENTLPLTHRDLAGSCKNIAHVCGKIGDYCKALFYYEKALEIQKQSAPPDDISLAISYDHIGLVYYNMNDYANALVYYEKALEIKRQILSSDDVSIAISLDDINMTRQKLKNFPTNELRSERSTEVSKFE